MRFLADENFPRPAVAALLSAGHDVTWVRIVAPGAPDTEVLALAAREERASCSPSTRISANWLEGLPFRKHVVSCSCACRCRNPIMWGSSSLSASSRATIGRAIFPSSSPGEHACAGSSDPIDRCGPPAWHKTEQDMRQGSAIPRQTRTKSSRRHRRCDRP